MTDGNGVGGGTAGTAVVRGGATVYEGAARPGEPTLRWRSRAGSIDDIQQELARIWAQPNLTTTIEGAPARHIAARTSVMNLVVIARRPETAERCAAIIQQLTGRHPSRTLICQPADPDGPSWLDAQIQAHCILPRADAPEVCAETIYLTAGGDTGRHLRAIVAPLLIHDLPVTVWWPGNPPFGTPQANDLCEMADRLVVDGSAWPEDGLRRLRQMAAILDRTPIAISDFALVRQSRWREAIASVFDLPDFLPYLRSLRRIAVTFATRDETGDPTTTNVVKPLYHVGWLGSRLGLAVSRTLEPVQPRGPRRPASTTVRGSSPRWGLTAGLRDGRTEIGVVIRPHVSSAPSGTTLRVELLAERRGRELRADVTAEAESVNVRVWEDGVEVLERHFQAPRRNDADLLAEAIEAGGPDRVAHDAIRTAAELAGGATVDEIEPAGRKGSALA
jgi:hypothetical protein